MQLRYQVLPDFEDFSSEEAGKVKELIAERAEKLSAWYGLKAEHERIRTSINDAMTEDKRARAQALRSGKKDPGRPAEEKARADMARIVDEMDVLQTVIEAVEADLTGALTEGKLALREEAALRRTDALRSYADAYRALREAHDAYHVFEGIEKWSLSPEAHFAPTPAHIAVLSLPASLLPEDPSEMEGTVRLVG